MDEELLGHRYLLYTNCTYIAVREMLAIWLYPKGCNMKEDIWPWVLLENCFYFLFLPKGTVAEGRLT